jgi:hypothetical protein
VTTVSVIAASLAVSKHDYIRGAAPIADTNRVPKGGSTIGTASGGTVGDGCKPA